MPFLPPNEQPQSTEGKFDNIQLHVIASSHSDGIRANDNDVSHKKKKNAQQKTQCLVKINWKLWDKIANLQLDK